jgi:hypothetical protein
LKIKADDSRPHFCIKFSASSFSALIFSPSSSSASSSLEAWLQVDSSCLRLLYPELTPSSSPLGPTAKFNNATQRLFGDLVKPVVYVWETNDPDAPWYAEARSKYTLVDHVPLVDGSFTSSSPG